MHTGEAIAGLIQTEIKSFGLKMEDLRGQGFDGGSNMAGKFIGVQARILEINPKALFVHCFAHRLNLVVEKAMESSVGRDLLMTLNQAGNFFNTPGRNLILKKHIDMAPPYLRGSVPKPRAKTRWVSISQMATSTRQSTVSILNAALEIVETAAAPAARIDAVNLRKAMMDYEFLFSLCVRNKSC